MLLRAWVIYFEECLAANQVSVKPFFYLITTFFPFTT